VLPVSYQENYLSISLKKSHIKFLLSAQQSKEVKIFQDGYKLRRNIPVLCSPTIKITFVAALRRMYEYSRTKVKKSEKER
jgi:hypothetical protein